MFSSKDKAKKSSSDARARMAVVRMLIAIWLVFVVCWAPYLTLSVMQRADTAWVHSWLPIKKWNLVNATLHGLSMTNSAINPILYAFMSR